MFPEPGARWMCIFSVHCHVLSKATRADVWMARRMPLVPLVWRKLLRSVRHLIIFVLFVKVLERVTEVFDLELGSYSPKVEGVDLDGADESRESHLLELVMDERADALRKSLTVRSRGGPLPVDVYGHHMCTAAW